MPNVRSLALGLWFVTGSCDEPEELAGIAHFTEHMNFKGTRRRSAGAIVREIEGRGGSLNAFTSKEFTCYYARVSDANLTRAVDVLADISLNSIYDEAETDRERAVILEELKSIEDAPDELVFEHFNSHLFGGHPLGRSIIGSRETLARITSEALTNYNRSRYRSAPVVVVAAGGLDHRKLVRLVERRLTDCAVITRNQLQLLPDGKTGINRFNYYTKTQQAHIVFGCRSYSYNDARKWPLMVLTTLLGGGMSSRLFQKVRERYGLAYSIYSFADLLGDTGQFGVYAATEPAAAEKVLNIIQRELRDLARNPVSRRELRRTKEQMKGNLILSLESPNSRMSRIAKMEIYNGRWLTLEDVLQKIDAVNQNDILGTAWELFENQATYETVLWPQEMM